MCCSRLWIRHKVRIVNSGIGFHTPWFSLDLASECILQHLGLRFYSPALAQVVPLMLSHCRTFRPVGPRFESSGPLPMSPGRFSMSHLGPPLQLPHRFYVRPIGRCTRQLRSGSDERSGSGSAPHCWPFRPLTGQLSLLRCGPTSILPRSRT